MFNKNLICRSVITLLFCLAISMIFILFGVNSRLQNEINDLKDHAEHLNDIISYQNIQINYMKYKLITERNIFKLNYELLYEGYKGLQNKNSELLTNITLQDEILNNTQTNLYNIHNFI